MSCCMVRAYPMITAWRISAVTWPAWRAPNGEAGQIVAIGSPATRYAPGRVSMRITAPGGAAATTARRLICCTHPSFVTPNHQRQPEFVQVGRLDRVADPSPDPMAVRQIPNQ